MSTREEFLKNPLANVGHTGDTVPPWLVAEAAQEEDWEGAFKENMEIERLGRHFAEHYLNKTTIENRQQVAKWDADKAAEWLKKQCTKDKKLDTNKASQILASAGATEERRTEVIALMGNGLDSFEEGKPADGSPTAILKKENTPSRIDELELQKSEKNLKEMRKRKTAGAFGIILTEDTCQLFRKGELITEVQTEEYGGYEIVASEMDALDTDKDVEAFFNLGGDEREIAKSGWFKPKAEENEDTEQTECKRCGLDLDVCKGKCYEKSKKAAIDCCSKATGKFCGDCGKAKQSEAALFDDTTFQLKDQQQADSGAFDPAGIDQASPGRDFAADPGPASVTPGAKTPISPSIPTLERPL